MTKIHNTKNKTQHNRNETGNPHQLATCLIDCATSDPITQRLIHQDLHLHQPGISVPRRPVRYHPSKGNQGSGLTSELLREKGSRQENWLTVRPGRGTHLALLCCALSVRNASASTATLFQLHVPLTKLVQRGPTHRVSKLLTEQTLETARNRPHLNTPGELYTLKLRYLPAPVS